MGQREVKGMKSILRLVLVSLVTLAFAGVALAQTGSTGSTGTKSTAPAKPAAEKKAPAPKVIRATGELTVADAKAGTAKVKTKDKELSLSAETEDAKESLGKVKVGDMVKVAYTEKDGKLTLKSLSKTKAPAKSTSTKSDKPMESKPATK
jgi:ribosomal 50S subunit-recycling heat shock protein